jgi:hypothetical protein
METLGCLSTVSFISLEVVMPEWSIDCKKSINLHYDDVNAAIGECEVTKEMVNTKMEIPFLNNNQCYAITEQDVNRHNLVPNVVVSLAGDHNVAGRISAESVQNQYQHTYLFIQEEVMAYSISSRLQH